MGPEELTTLLWRERELLELLIFKLDEEQLILQSGKTRWLDHATREVQHVMDRLRAASFERATVASAVAISWGLPEEGGLQDLASAAADGPWGEILLSHFAALATQVEHVRSLRDTNLQFLRAGLRSSQETVAALGTDAGTYNHLGRTDQDAGSRFLDKSV